MNKQEELLRRKTMNLFNDKWYEETVKSLLSIESNSKGYVYFIKTRRDDNIKIGLSVNLNSRLSSLKTGFSDGLYLVGFIYSSKFKDLEKEAHIDFNEKRTSGEWFDISKKEAEIYILKKGGVVTNGFYSSKSSVIDGLSFNISKQNEDPSLSFYQDFFKFCDENLKEGEKYENQIFRESIKRIKKEYNKLSPKRVTMTLKTWCDINDFKLKKGNSDTGRFFYYLK